MNEKFDWLKAVLRGTFVLPEQFAYVKGVLLKAFDEQEMRDRLDKLKRSEPGIFLDRPQRGDDKAEIVNGVMREIGCTQPGYLMVKSFLRHGTSRESMVVTVEKLRKSNPSWFKRR